MRRKGGEREEDAAKQDILVACQCVLSVCVCACVCVDGECIVETHSIQVLNHRDSTDISCGPWFGAFITVLSPISWLNGAHAILHVILSTVSLLTNYAQTAIMRGVIMSHGLLQYVRNVTSFYIPVCL